MEAEILSPLVEYGIVGICIALIILVALLLNWMFKIFGNHINHNTQALTKLEEKLSEDINSQKESSRTLRDLKEVINSKIR